MDDDELIDRLAGGDETALRELFGRHAPVIATRLRALLPAADVEDVLQETFVAAWRGAGGYRARAEGSVGGWLWGIARRQTAMWLRRRTRDGTFHAAATGLDPAELDAAIDRAMVEDPATSAASRIDLDTALAALGPADGPEREIWRLLFVEDRPVAQVAAMTGVPEGTVKSRAHRVRKSLRTALAGRAVDVEQGGS